MEITSSRAFGDTVKFVRIRRNRFNPIETIIITTRSHTKSLHEILLGEIDRFSPECAQVNAGYELGAKLFDSRLSTHAVALTPSASVRIKDGTEARILPTE